MTPRFVRASLVEHRAEIVALNVEYMTWVFDETRRALAYDVAPQGEVRRYIESAVDKIYAGAAACYLVDAGGVAAATDVFAAMGALRTIRDGAGELKRMYVRPQFRGHKLGEALLEMLVEDARALGLSTLLLDSAPFMTAAHALYRKHGFVDRGPYPETDMPAALHARWRFMERAL